MMDELQYDPVSHIFEDADFGDDDHILSILDTLDDDIISPSSTRSHKRQKISEDVDNGQPKVSHITVERNRRRQMNHQISILRSLMPTFYVKRGDQASVIGGVVDYINELQQLVQSLEAKKQRKILYTDVVSPRGPIPSPGPSPRPRVNLPISPGTPQPGSYLTNSLIMSHCVEPSPTSSSSASSCGSINVNDDGVINELTANSKSPIADVEVRFSGPHLVLKTQSPPIPGQALKIIAALHHFPLEILHLTVTTAHQTMVNSFTIKIGIECQLSAEDLAQQVQQTFCQPY